MLLSGLFFVAGIMVVLSAWTNPRLRALAWTDALRLISVGLFFGVCLGLVSQMLSKD
jgi:hypothetical protein